MAANLSSSPTLISQEGKPTDVIVVPLVFPTVTPPVTEPVSLPPPLDSHDYGLEIQLSLWLLLIVSGAFLYPRIFCRISRHLTWWDDTLLAISWIFLLGDVILVNQQVLRGFGKPFAQVDPTNLVAAMKMGLAATTLSTSATGISKTSFIVTMLRLTYGRMKQFIWVILVVINLVMGVTGLFVWIQCIPMAKLWDPTIDGACWDPNVDIYWGRTASITSGIIDFLLTMLAWWVIWGLRMNKKERVGVAVAMSFGIAAGIVAFIKARMIVNTTDPNANNYSHLITIVAAAEPAATIIAASIPVLRILFVDDQHLDDSKRASSDRYYNIKGRIGSPIAQSDAYQAGRGWTRGDDLEDDSVRPRTAGKPGMMW